MYVRYQHHWQTARGVRIDSGRAERKRSWVKWDGVGTSTSTSVLGGRSTTSIHLGAQEYQTTKWDGSDWEILLTDCKIWNKDVIAEIIYSSWANRKSWTN